MRNVLGITFTEWGGRSRNHSPAKTGYFRIFVLVQGAERIPLPQAAVCCHGSPAPPLPPPPPIPVGVKKTFFSNRGLDVSSPAMHASSASISAFFPVRPDLSLSLMDGRYGRRRRPRAQSLSQLPREQLASMPMTQLLRLL